MNGQKLQEFRCECGKLFFKSNNLSGNIEIKCRRCGKVKLIEVLHGNNIEANLLEPVRLEQPHIHWMLKDA